MDEVLLIHDWQAMPHVVMNLLCCRRSCATTAVDNLRGARVNCCRSSACVLSAH